MSRTTFIAIQTVDEFLALSHMERSTLVKFHESFKSKSDPKERLQQLIIENGHSVTGNQYLPFIIKASHTDELFAAFCASPVFNERWKVGAAEHLLRICIKLGLPTFDMEFENSLSCFDHLRGMFLYIEALKISEHTGTQFPISAIGYLKLAITKYRSIHALQAYNRYRHQEIDAELNKPEPNYGAIESYYLDIIADCQLMTKDYGSFAYMMMADAEVRFALTLSSKPDKTAKECASIHHFFSQASESCHQADKQIVASAAAIAFASLDRGLGVTNHFGITEPREARRAVTALMTGTSTEEDLIAGRSGTTPATSYGK
ncbi:MAG: DUF5630 domain-containing protein [Coxiellaceae bacterium]|nr:DUF5630 domain-containing protein [Coxiellaceae bacterium]